MLTSTQLPTYGNSIQLHTRGDGYEQFDQVLRRLSTQKSLKRSPLVADVRTKIQHGRLRERELLCDTNRHLKKCQNGGGEAAAMHERYSRKTTKMLNFNVLKTVTITLAPQTQM